MKKNKIFKLLSIALVISFIGVGCKGSGTIEKSSLSPVTLKYWQVFNEQGDFTDIIAAFKIQYPQVTVEVKKLRIEEYEDAIIRALAEGQGPDIISVQTSWLKEYSELLETMPKSVTIPATYYEKEKPIKELETLKMPTGQDLRNLFVDTVYEDAILGSEIYGLPLSVDTLALYYNRQMLNQAGITTPAKTWEELKEHVKLLTKQDSNGNIVQSGAALGGARNINRAMDILSVLMMQNGTQMTQNQKASFNIVPTNLNDKQVAPGRDALRFYTDFASPTKEVYSWHENMPESVSAFANQKTAYLFSYSYSMPVIRSLNPGLDFGVVKLPQISTSGKQINFANYWLECVTKGSKNKNEAWAFVQFMTSKEQVSSFLKKSGKPTAMREYISEQRKEQDLQAFAEQLLTAKTWYKGGNADAAEEAFRIMIEQIVKGAKQPDEAINEAIKTINLTY